ncbi:FAD-dependent monooxygenase [Streptomyces fuscigenes]|uniref:FAD-dependent monooxygenase n=1 Tax=Streptomyces fuscigenes TaxID=1528880 RepID=UPI001F447BA0|nr:FAD-dependent monooxygenase [Streptomyces fuscigenes]MCF3961813.1 FAD-dependent monooxygenase [Streptomyces fuscigenes]
MTGTPTRTTPLRGRRVLISGAGVAGPALALRLLHHGADVTVVEAAPELRGGGFAVDFRGPVHLGVLERMGVLEELRALRTGGSAMRCVDADGREVFTLPAEFTGGELEVLRRDLSRVLHERTAGRAEYVFGDTVTYLAETPHGMHVDFARSPSRTVDLVVGADGLHSGTRAVAFGEEARFVRHLGHCLAGWSLPNDGGWTRTSEQFNVPGRMVSAAADRATQAGRACSSCSARRRSPTTGTTRMRTGPWSRRRSTGCRGAPRNCSPRWTARGTSTSTRSAASRCPGGPVGGSPCSATPPGG